MISNNEYKEVRKYNSKMQNNIGYGHSVYYDKNEVILCDPRNKKEIIANCRLVCALINGKYKIVVFVDAPVNKQFEIADEYKERREYNGYYIYINHIMIDLDYYEEYGTSEKL